MSNRSSVPGSQLPVPASRCPVPVRGLRVTGCGFVSAIVGAAATHEDWTGLRERRRALLSSAATCAVLLALAASTVSAQDAAPQADHPGKPAYDRWCAGCHGVEGGGDGPAAAYMLPRPRNFTLGQYQIRRTPSGEMPTDDDLLHVIDEGMPGTTMPGWRRELSDQERRNLVAYVKTFSPFFEGAEPTPLDLGRAPGASVEVIEEGRQVYQQLECWKCHGESGRGDGESAPTQEDDAGFPIRPADLTRPWQFNGGGTVEDIFRTLRTGLMGTPMPSYADAVDAGIITLDQLWAVAHYVRSLAPEDPVVRDVVRAERVDGEVPAAPDDSAWADVERFYIPLVGQIVESPRWFSPAVTGVWVQALHNGEDIALRLSWSDRSRSPSPVWAGWRARVLEVMEPKEGGTAPESQAQAPAGAGTGPANAADAPQEPMSAAGGAAPSPAQQTGAPDAIAVQFPQRLSGDMQRPYFLMGSEREPVYLWHWQSEPDQATEMLARGLALEEPLPGGANALGGQSAYDGGEWRVVLRRPLVAADTANAISLTTQQPIPIAFFAWDGDNGEEGARGAMSPWYFIYLDEPASATVYATPLVAMLVTAGLGVFAVGRAQRRERERARNGDGGGVAVTDDRHVVHHGADR